MGAQTVPQVNSSSSNWNLTVGWLALNIGGSVQVVQLQVPGSRSPYFIVVVVPNWTEDDPVIPAFNRSKNVLNTRYNSIKLLFWVSIGNWFFLSKISFIRLLAKKGDRSTSSTRVHPLTVVQLESQLSTTRRGITRADGRVTIWYNLGKFIFRLFATKCFTSALLPSLLYSRAILISVNIAS
jgi:hypothetical protein